MKTRKLIAAFSAIFAAGMSFGGTICTCTTSPVAVDTVTVAGNPIVDSLPISYDAAWIGGDANATVVIADNGTEVRRTTGAGEFTHTLTGDGRHELTYTTYIGGVAQDEVYTATVFKNWKYNISNVTAKQRFPWNGKVDITYTLTGDVTAGFLVVTASNRVDGTTYAAAASALSGDTGTAEGVHHVVWDLNAQGLEIKSDEVVFTVAYHALYCIIDLSGGASAESYPVTYVSSLPTGGFNTDEYKTTKLVLRLIEPGAFKMQNTYDVTLTKAFYCGVFEVTQKQYELVTGSNPSYYKGDMRPVEKVSWNTIRGNSSTYNWPGSSAVDPNSFVGRLQSRTGLNFDLPTEAQWEYACRAGTASTYNNGGDTESDLKLVGRYWDNCSDGKGGYTDAHTTVGSYEPNAWGLYDMHGNVWEWCLDWYGSLSGGVTDPGGSSSGSYRVLRGGGWYDGAGSCTSSYRNSINPSYEGNNIGFRLVRTLSNTEGERSPEAAAGAERAALCSGESASVGIDSRVGMEPVVDAITLPWNAAWIGVNTNATVVIMDNGTEVRRATGAGEFAYTPSPIGRHELTYTTYINDVAQEETYSATVYAKWKYEVEDGNAIITATTQAAGKVTVPSEIDGYPVTNIGVGAFSGCSAEVTVHAGALKGVQENVFGACSLTVIVTNYDQRIPGCVAGNVRKVVFADGVARIKDNYFEECVNLETMDIPESVVRIGTNVFEACSALETVVTNGCELYQGWCLRRVGDNAPCQIIPDGVRGIAAGAFEGEYGIETVEIPSTVRFVGARAFKDCTSLEEIVLPEGVAIVDREAFRNCTYAQDLSLPLTLREIDAGAFANCTLLMGVTVPDGVLDVGEYAFSNCWRMLSAELPYSVTNVGVGAFADCRRLTGVTVPFHVDTMANLFPAAYDKIATVAVAERCVEGEDAQERVPPMVPGMFAGCGAMESLTLPEDLAEVSADAFVGCTNMAAFNLPDTVTNIGARAFKDLRQLAAFAFPTGLVVVGEEAFSGCSGIGTLSLPDGLESIGARAFRGLTALARVEIPANVRTVGTAAFGGCTAVRAISLPGGATTVSAAFPDTYWQITSATVVGRRVGDAVPYQIIPSLFEGCSALAHVEMNAGVTEIGARAFKGCSALTTLGIPSGVTTLGTEAFRGCSNLSQMALPKELTVLPDYVFAGCSSLSEVVVPEKVTTIGASVFNGCSLLRSVRFVGNAPAYAAGAYDGVPSALVTYVVNGSTGWDGIPTSKTLPEFWPAGTTQEITWWEPNRFMVTFDPNGGDGESVEVEQVTGTTYVLPSDVERVGSSFSGWWTAREGGARVTAVTKVELTRPHTFYAHWTFNRYTVRFDANGGLGEMEGQELSVATSALLSECGFSRPGYAFEGWATEPDGEVVYTNAAEVVNLTYEQGAYVTLYAVWSVREWTLGDALFDGDGAVAAQIGDATDWTIDFETSHDGVASVRSGTIGAADDGGRTNTTLAVTVTGGGSGSFWWKVHCEEMDGDFDEWYDYAVFAIDGVEVAKIAGNSGWRQVEYTVTGPGPHALSWTFTRDDYDEDGATWENAAWVDEFTWTPTPVTVTFAGGGAAEGVAPEAVTKYEGYGLVLPGAGTLANGEYVFMGWTDGTTTWPAGATYVVGSSNVTMTAVWELRIWTLGEAVDASEIAFTTGGAADWTVDSAFGHTNAVSVKSGTVTGGQTSWIEATVNGAGTLTFCWNVMGGIYRNNPFAYAKVEVDGVQQAQEHNTDGWKEQAVAVEGAGTHTIRWTYLRTSNRAADGDRAWLDAVTWTPVGGAADVVVDVGDGKSVTVPGDWLTNITERIEAAGGDITTALQSTAANGRLSVVECYVLGLDPDDTTNDFKIVSFPMKADGTPDLANIVFEPPQAQWNVPATWKVKGAASLEGPWGDVPAGGNPAYRFFKVEVVVP